MTTPSMTQARNSRTIYPMLYTIQYPQCPRGMFSLRPPFKDLKELPPVQPIYGNMINSNDSKLPSRQTSKRNASIQCSLLLPNVRHEVAVQTNMKSEVRPVAKHSRSRRRIPSSESDETIYEIWQIESPRTSEFVSIDSRRGKLAKDTAVFTDDDEDEDVENDVNSHDDQEHVIYARQAGKPRKKTYLPSNVRMICVRDEPTRTFH